MHARVGFDAQGVEMLKISLLGGFLVEYDGRNLPPISSTAGRSLLAYLITYRSRRHTRDLLAGTFWPDFAEASARKRLSQALWQIHTALRSAGADVSLIEVTPSDVAFNSEDHPCWLDVEEFERLALRGYESRSEVRLSIGLLEKSVELYRGQFLEGFYDNWMMMEQQRLTDLYFQTLERLVTLHKARADYASALSYARRLVVEDPVRETAHREVMRISFLLGRSGDALQQYDRCVAILNEELGVRPTAQTRQLQEEIAQLRDKGERPFVPGPDSPLLADPRQTPLIGREDERTIAVRRIEDTLAGHGGVLLVEGEPGIGKTRFLNELVSDAHWRGASVLWSRSDSRDQLRPYHAIGDAMSAGVGELRARQLQESVDHTVLEDLVRVAPRLRGVFQAVSSSVPLPPLEAQGRMRRSIGGALLALAEFGSLVLCLDDAHWIDPESLEILTQLCDDLSQTRLLMVLSFRSEEARDRREVWEALRRLDLNAHPTRIRLNGLDRESTSQLVYETTGITASHDVVDGVYHETGGNPLFVLETLRTMHDSAVEAFDPDDTDARVEQSEVVPGVSRVIERRLANLDAEARVVLNSASILGSRFNLSLLTRMSRLTPSETLNGLARLVQRGIVVEEASGYEFSHYQMRTVSLEGLRPSVRRRLHREAAAALEAEHPERVEDLAFHYSAAEMAEPAMRMAWQAGARAMTLSSYESAVRFLAEALEWATEQAPPASEFMDLLRDLFNSLDVLAEREEQLRVADVMEEVAAGDAALTAEASGLRSSVLAHLGRYGEAMEEVQRAFGLLPDDESPEAIAHVERTAGSVYSMAGNPAEAARHLRRAIELAADRTMEQADTRHALGDVLAELQRYDEARDQLQRALSTYEEGGNARGIVDAKGMLAILNMETGNVEPALELYEEARALAHELGYRRAEAVNLVNLANLQYVRGRISVALSNYLAAATAFGSIKDRRGEALATANAASVRYLVLGDDTRARQEAAEALEFFDSVDHEWGSAFCLEILAGILQREEDYDAARIHIETALRLVERSGHRWLETHLQRHMAEIELAVGHRREARRRIERARGLCLDLGLSNVMPTVESVAALVALSEGAVEEAHELSQKSLEAMTDSVEQPYLVWFRAHQVAEAWADRVAADRALAESCRLLDAILSDVPSSVGEDALRNVPEHRQITDARRRRWPEVVRVRVPRAEVPLGRRLVEGDLIEVEWTVREPGDYALATPVERRRMRIQRMARQAAEGGGAPRVTDLAGSLGVSEATLRRDIKALRRRGLSIRTRGSSVSS